jgi:hypothetical protein
MSDLSDARNQVAAAQRDATTLAARIKQERAALDAAARQGRTAQVASHQQAIATLTNQRSAALTQAGAAAQRVETLRQQALAATGRDPIGTPDSSLPIVLLPVRLETKYRTSGNATELLIRIYPDAAASIPTARSRANGRHGRSSPPSMARNAPPG